MKDKDTHITTIDEEKKKERATGRKWTRHKERLRVSLKEDSKVSSPENSERIGGAS